MQSLQVGFVLGPVDRFFKVQCPQSGTKIYLETLKTFRNFVDFGRLSLSIQLLGSFENDIAMVVKYSIYDGFCMLPGAKSACLAMTTSEAQPYFMLILFD